MSATSNTLTPHSLSEPAWSTTVSAALRRWWMSFGNMLLERAAIAALRSMSDRELRDMGVYRCEIEQCVRLDASNHHSAGRQRSAGNPR